MAGVPEDEEIGVGVIEGPRAFVAGWPVRHSRSPLIHGAWLRAFALPGSYEPVAVPPEAFAGFLRRLGPDGFVGGNVTIPHKEAAFAAVERRDAAAEAIGAVNTMWLENRRLVGGNTDAYGFAANLDERLPGWAAAGQALVLGAGGAARAVVHALLERGIPRVRVLNRNRARAEALAERFGPRVSAHGEDERSALLAAAELLVNTVPGPGTGARDGDGDRDGPEPPLPDLAALPGDALVTDIVYVPLETPTIRAAKARGLRTADGLGMLLHQAVPGFERWFGRRPAVGQGLRDMIVRDIERYG